MLLWPVIALIAGLIALVWSADRFVAGAAAIAHNYGMPHILIGVTIVSMGTSAPEILVSANAALHQSVNLAIGNAIGSNIANIGLVLGITALIAPLPVSARVMKTENLIVLAVTALAGFCLYDGDISRADGLLLLSGLILFLFWIFLDARKSSDNDFDDEIPTSMATGPALFWFIAGLTVLIISARGLVWGATEIAGAFGVPELIIGATIVAIGTSLPELAASVASAMKGHHDIAIGNVLGSNIFNLLAVLCVPGLVAPGLIAPEVISRDFPVMAGLTLLLCAMLLVQGNRQRPLGRIFSLTVLVIYVYYLAMNYGASNL